MSIIRTEPRYSVLSFIEKSKHYDHLASYNSLGATRVLAQPLGTIPPFQLIKTTTSGWVTMELVRYADGNATDIEALLTLTGFEVLEFDAVDGYNDYDVHIYPGSVPLPLTTIKEGLHYLRFQDYDGNYVVSEMFTFIDKLEERRDYVKVEWWNLSEFVLDTIQSGEVELKNAHIQYNAPFKWYIYLKSNVAKHGWVYDAKASERQGIEYFESITKHKEFSFRFGVPEHLADVLSYLPQHDQRTVTYDGETWERIWKFEPKFDPIGDMYGVQVVFKTNPHTRMMHNVGLASTAYEVADGTCLTSTTCLAIITNGTAEYNGGYAIDSIGANRNFSAGDFVIIDVLGVLVVREAACTNCGTYNIPTVADFSNWWTNLDARETVGQVVDSYYFAVSGVLYAAPYKLTETIVGTDVTVTGNSFGSSLVQIICKDADDNEWVGATVTDSVFRGAGATFDALFEGREVTAYKLRALTYRCPNIAESEWYALEGVGFDEINDDLVVYPESIGGGSGSSGSAPSPDDEP